MWRHRFDQPGPSRRQFDGALHRRIRHMMPAGDLRLRVNTQFRRWKHPLPAPFPFRIRILQSQSSRQPYPPILELPDRDSLRASGIRHAIHLLDEAVEKNQDVRFQAQARQSRRQFRIALAVACLALLVSLASVAYQVWRDCHAEPSAQSSGSSK